MGRLLNRLLRSHPEPGDDGISLDKCEARIEAGEAITRLEQTRQLLQPAVDSKVTVMRRIREENHLADVIRASLGGRI